MSCIDCSAGGVGGGVGGGAARSTVFINGVGFEVVAGLLNVWEVFGKEAILVHASGHPVLTDDWGLTLHPLQHGASYYLVNILSLLLNFSFSIVSSLEK